jgi:hypothetical protein
VWEDSEGFRGYYEVERPGEIEDIEVGPFTLESEARKAVEMSLEMTYPAALK